MKTMFKFLLIPILALPIMLGGCNLLTGESDPVSQQTEQNVLDGIQNFNEFGEFLDLPTTKEVIEKVKKGEELLPQDISVLSDIAVEAYETFSEISDTIAVLSTDYEQYKIDNPESTPLDFWLQIGMILLAIVTGGPIMRGATKTPVVLKYGTQIVGSLLSKILPTKGK